MEIQVMKCPCCGANINLEKGKNTAVCEYCDSKVVFDIEIKDGSEESEPKKSAKVFTKDAADSFSDRTSKQQPEKNDAEKIESWKKRRKIWIIGLIVAVFLTGLFNANFFSTVFVFWLVGGAVYISRTKPASLKNNISNKPDSERKYNCREYPWYLKTGWIILFGFFTGGIYWIFGIIMRHELRK